MTRSRQGEPLGSSIVGGVCNITSNNNGMRIIEKANIDLLDIFDKVSEEAKKEKNAIPPINKICYWWTRKPMIVSRAMVLASTLSAEQISSSNSNSSNNKSSGSNGSSGGSSNDSNSNVIYIHLQINKDNGVGRAYTKKPDIQAYKRLLGKDPSTIKVLDCFAGGGNIIFEAARWNLSCYALDYNPVAYLIKKATLEYPRRYNSRLADDVEHYGKEVIKRVNEELNDYYYYHHPDNAKRRRLTYLYAWCIICPYCKQRVPLLNHMWLANTDKKKIGLKIRPDSDDNSKGNSNGSNNFSVRIVNDIDRNEGEKFTHRKDKVICIRCRNTIDYEQMTSDIAKRKDYEMLAVVVEGIKGKDYMLVDEKDRQALKRAEEKLKKHWTEFDDEGLIPNEEMGGALFRLKNYGFTRWYEIYNPRQLLLMVTLLKHVRNIAKEIECKHGREYAKVITTYLALLIAKHVDYNCNCIGWNVVAEKIFDALAMRSPRFIYNFAEVNPFEETSGSLYSMLENIVSAIKFANKALNTSNTITIHNASALHLSKYFSENYFDLIITDPPYLDDVVYGEVSEFFYVWLYRALKDCYPELPTRVPIDDDIVLAKERFDGDRERAMKFYKTKLGQAFKEMYKVLKDNGLAVIFFAHSSTEAWKLLLEILMEAKFQVKQSYAIHTERTGNLLARNKASFMSSICIACRKLPQTYKKEEYYEKIRSDIENKIKGLINHIPIDRLFSSSTTDLILMMFGKALEEITQYTSIKSYKAGFKFDSSTILDSARSSIVKLLLERIIEVEPEALGREISSYLLFRIFYNGSLNADETLLLVKALNTDIDSLIKKEVIIRNKSIISLLPFYKCKRIISKRDDEIDANNLHEQLIYIEHIAQEKGARYVNRLFQLPNFNKLQLEKIITILIHRYKIKNNVKKLSDDEKKEYEILQSIMDVIRSTYGRTTSELGNLDKYMR
ncbi:MAG: DUF1156 domain-containing protein [Candidatus Nitrosocaldaceae archaeon]